MWLIDLVAIICVIAGCAIIGLGFMLGMSEYEVHRAIGSTSRNLGDTSKSLPKTDSGGIAETAEQQAVLHDVTEATRALAELANSMKGLSPAVQAFLISVVFFLISAALAGLALFGPG